MTTEIDQVVSILSDPAKASTWFSKLGISDIEHAQNNLKSIREAGVTIDLISVIMDQLETQLPHVSDPDMALNNLDRFIKASRSPLSLGALIERDGTAMPILLRIFSTSQHLSDLMVRDPESYDMLRLTEGQPVACQMLIDDLCSELATVSDTQLAMVLLRRFKHREILRVAYGDIVGQHPIESVISQISYIADAIVEAALRFARRKLERKRGVPRGPDGQPARFVVLALGKLGGVELNYSSDIDLIMFYDVDGKTDGAKSVSNGEFFSQLARDVFKLLTEPTEMGFAYRTDMRLRPQGRQGPMVNSLEGMLQYYDISGRTWERQAFVKARPIAGDIDLGSHLLQKLEPWIYRKYLSRADITGIKALKRRIEQRSLREGEDERNVKTGRGGIRDIEFVIQFLQLLNGGDTSGIRTSNTLEAIAQLEMAGCLTLQERSKLTENYSFLRKIEHRLQIMFDLQTHTLPTHEEELRKLAIRMGFKETDDESALSAFRSELESKTNLNRMVLDHLLHNAFGTEEEVEPEVDLILDPDPAEEVIHEIMSKYRFDNPRQGYQNLMALSHEKIAFLSTRRCRHFLAAIAPQLLEEIAQTPDPDFTLLNLSQVSDSLGGKGVLWELFSYNQATLRLYVTLCASSPYLSGILTSNPGMIDELMDSLVLERLPDMKTLEETLEDLCRGAEDTEPILHSFKNSQHLRVGVRDILGKDNVRRTHRALSDVAEVCLKQITQQEYEKLVGKYGEPLIDEGKRAGEVCELIIIAMGKLGGQEPNYHSDLDVVFLYQGAGSTKHRRPEKSTSNQHFFSQLAARVIKTVTHMSPYGRLYDLDPRLRPTGKSGALAVSIDEFKRYFKDGRGQLWERQALCKSRPIYGSMSSWDDAMEAIKTTIIDEEWKKGTAEEIRKMRFRMEETASKENIKRGPGGTVDIEFVVQMLQLKYVKTHRTVLTSGTLDAAQELRAFGCLSKEDCDFFSHSYRYLRSIEAGLRLMNTTARHDMPKSVEELTRLAYLLNRDAPEELSRRTAEYRLENRNRFNRIFDEADK